MPDNDKTKAEALAAAQSVAGQADPAAEEKDKEFYEKLVVHSMPERFLKTPSQAVHRSSKFTGILILLGGGLVLIGLLVFLYYFLLAGPGQETANPETGSQKQALTGNEEEPAGSGEAVEEKPENESSPEPEEEDEPKKEEEPEELEIVATSSPETDQLVATSSEKIATSTDLEAETRVLTRLQPSPDSDQDGLFDEEERLLGTDAFEPDSDGDGYEDGDELGNLYNPAGSGSLMANEAMGKYTNASFAYSLYYPRGWEIREVGGDESLVFEIGNDQFVQLMVHPLEADSLEMWYRNNFPEHPIKAGQLVYKKGWSGIKSENSLIYYLSHPASDQVFTVTYNPGLKDTAPYRHIFEMMVDSLAYNG